MENLSDKYNFLNRVNPILLTLYPLQVANMERLEKNDAVFVFDEVGCGKTVSSGLMALSYLEQEQYKDKKVLVITINSLVKTGQFLNEWYKRVPFTKEQKERITVINDHVIRIKDAQKENWGLIIVDEAQLFLSDSETGKGEALKKLKGDKVVFLTATPIRKSEKDLEEYVEIASNILRKEHAKVAGEEVPKALWVEKTRKELSENIKGKERTEDNICAKFCPSLPITRYFKDTVRFLEKPSGESSKNASKRRFAEVWRVANEGEVLSKEECLFKNIDKVLNEDNKNEHHFVVFATKQQAEALGGYFSAKGFEDYNRRSQNDRTYRVITGYNSEELKDFKEKEDEKNPTILFVNYQIAEQGLNLPGFDYVVNYQISRYPSRLEQRFGRIDRLDKDGEGKFEAINICYILDKDLFDTSTRNFYLAVEAYLNAILPFLPSRNTVLTYKIMEELDATAEETKKSLNLLKAKLEKGETLSKKEKEIIDSIRKDSIKADEENEEVEIEERGSNVADDLTALESVGKRLTELQKWQEKRNEQVKLAEKIGVFKDTSDSDNIFIRYNDKRNSKTITSKDCELAIRGKTEYKRYCELIASFSNVHKVKELHDKKVTHAINSYLILAFALGDLNALYPLDGYKRQMKRILDVEQQDYLEMVDRVCRDKDAPATENNSRRVRFQYAVRILRYTLEEWERRSLTMEWTPIKDLSEEDKIFLVENAEYFLSILPIYHYLSEVGSKLQIYNGNVFENGNLDLDKEKETYWEKHFSDGKYWRFYIEGEDGWEPSPILKLFYHYQRLEASFYSDINIRHKLFRNREKECSSLLGHFLDYVEMSDSKEKEAEKKKIKEEILVVKKINKEVSDWYKDKGTVRCVVSWYGNIFNMINENKSGLKIVKRHNWRLKKSSCEWYADNNNRLSDVWLKKLLFNYTTIKKKLDYWSYNLVLEMLLPDYLNYNAEVGKIYRSDNSEYGFDLDAIGFTEEIRRGADRELAQEVLCAISPWLFGEWVPPFVKKDI